VAAIERSPPFLDRLLPIVQELDLVGSWIWSVRRLRSAQKGEEQKRAEQKRVELC
jgi:hypothetical protein